MSPAGYSGTPLARKLGIREGSRVSSIGGPPSFTAELGELPEGAELVADPELPKSAGDPRARAWDVIVLFARDAGALTEHLDDAVLGVAWDGGLWIAWPKASSSLATDLSKSAVRRAGLVTGLVDNKVCAIDDDWSGLRFVHRREDRP